MEAAILFPLVIGLTVGGFALMTRWYSQWEQGLEYHQDELEQQRKQDHLNILHWEQWGTLWEEVYE